MRKIVAAVQTKRHHHLSGQNLPKDQNLPRALIETDMRAPDTKYPAKIRELDVHHISIAYIACDVVYAICYVAVGKKSHACGGDVQSKPKRKHNQLYNHPLP